MAFTGFIKALSGHNVTTSSFFFTSGMWDFSQLLAFADIDKDHCRVDRIEYYVNDKSSFRVHIKDIKREYLSQYVPFQFHLIYTTIDGKIYKQTVEYAKELHVWHPQELRLTLFDIGKA